MESPGSKLRTTREAKGVSVFQVSQETNIAMRYLEALEGEDYSVFPGEAYALGFLKNYGAYLDLDAADLLSLYRATKIQEQEVPIEEILKSPSQAPKVLIITIVVLLALGLIGVAAWFFVPQIIRILNASVGNVSFPRSPIEYSMNNSLLERRFYLGDSILIPLGTESFKMELVGLGDNVNLVVDDKMLSLDLSQEVKLDLNEDGFEELSIFIADFARNDSSAGVLIRLELEPAPWDSLPELVSVEGLSPGSQGSVVIFTSPNPYPFTLEAVFQTYCFFRWEVLFEPNRQGRNEHYYQQFDELNIQAQNGIRIGLSNANAVRLQVIGGGRTIALNPGGPGEVVVADIRWLRDETNLFRLMFSRLE